MSLWSDIKTFITLRGQHTLIKEQRRKSTYVANPEKGYWINRGTFIDEDWQWVEPIKIIEPISYVMVFETVPRNYLITASHTVQLGCLEYVDCSRFRDFDLAVRMYIAGYSVLGQTKIDTSVEHFRSLYSK